jgi:hypothetical protein
MYLCPGAPDPSVNVTLVSAQKQAICMSPLVLLPDQVQTPDLIPNLTHSIISHSSQTQISAYNPRGKFQEARVRSRLWTASEDKQLVWSFREGREGRKADPSPACTAYHWQSTCLFLKFLSTLPQTGCVRSVSHEK